MKKFLIILLSFLFCVNLSAQPRGGTPPTRIEEEDGSPSVRARTVKFPNTSVTDNADGTASIDFIGGSLPTTYLKLDGTNTMTGNVNMSNDTWIGLGAGKGNILFDDSNDVIDVQNVDFRLPADDQKFALGAAGTTDSYLQWDGAGVDFYSSGGIYDFNAAANTDIVMNFPGTTESGKITWDEDEGTFVFGDDTGNALQWNYPVHISTDTDGKGLQIGPQDEGDAGDHPSFLSMSKKFTADTGDQFRGIHNEYQWQAQNAYNIINMVNTAKFTGTATYTQADVRGVLAQLESDNDNVTISSYRAFEAQAPAAWLGGGSFHGTLTDYYGLYINKPTAAVNEWGIYTELATPIMFGGADNGGTVGLGMVSMRATSLDQLSLEYDATTSWQFRTGSGGALLLKNDGSETIRVTENNALGIGVVPSETNNEKFATLKNDYDTSGANDQYYRKHTGTVATGGAKAFHGNREILIYNASENQTGIFVNTYSGLQYSGTGDSTNNYGYILNLELRSTATITNLYGFTPVGYNFNNIAGTVGTYYGFRDRGFDAEDGTLSTAAYNFYGDAHRVDGGSFNGTAYGIFLKEQTVGASNYEMWIDGGGEIFFRDNAIHVGSLTDGHLDLTADVSVDFNTPVLDLSAQTVSVTLNNAVDALNFDSNTLSIDASNNYVGIGTATPDTKLQISGTNTKVRLTSTDDADTLYVIKANGANKYNFGYESTNGNFDIAGTSFTTNKYFSIDTSGNVGIGEPAPQDKLEVNGITLLKDKLCFTQDDRAEYIDSLNDGFMDYGATTAHRFLADIKLTGDSRNLNQGIDDDYAQYWDGDDFYADISGATPGAGVPDIVMKLYNADGTSQFFVFDSTDNPVFYVNSNGGVTAESVYRTESSLYSRYYHLGLASFDPGASGAVWTSAGANTVGGWQLDNAAEMLETKVDIHSDWDGATDLNVELRFQINAASAENDTVDIDVVFYYMGLTETTTKTQTITGSVNVGDGGIKPQFTMFAMDVILPYDTGGAVVDAGDCIAMNINLNTVASEVDNIILNAVTYNYQTTHSGIENGDT